MKEVLATKKTPCKHHAMHQVNELNFIFKGTPPNHRGAPSGKCNQLL